MDKKELIKLVSEKLEASKNEVKVAFNIFIRKVAEQAEIDSALRIAEIGIFHLKKKDPEQHDRYNLLFLPLKYNPQGKNKILSFDVNVTKEADLTAGESAFDISIGKPLIPVTGVNRRDFAVHSSFIMLQKKFEEKSESILSKAVQLTDLKIDTRLIETDDEIIDAYLDDYGAYEQINEEAPEIPWDFGFGSETNLTYSEAELTDNTANENLSEDDAEIEIPSDALPDFKNISTAENKDEVEDEPPEQEYNEIPEINNIEENIFTEPEISLEPEIPVIDENPDVTEGDQEQDYPPVEERLISDEQIQELLSEDSVSEEENNNLLSDESIFSADEYPDAASELNDFSEEEIPVEESLNNKLVETENDQDYNDDDQEDFRITEDDLGLAEGETTAFNQNNYSGQDNEYSIPEEESGTLNSRMQILTPFQTGKDYMQEDDKQNFKVKYGLWFWIILAFFIFLTVGGLYYFLFYTAGNNKLAEDKKAAEQNIVKRDYDIPVNIIPESDTTKLVSKSEGEQREGNAEENISDKTVPAFTEQKQNIETPIISADYKNTLVKEYIFSDGQTFTLQISSWKTKSVAVKETARLKESGYPSYLSEYISKGGQKWYRVRVGEFSSLAQTEDFLGKNSNKLFK